MDINKVTVRELIGQANKVVANLVGRNVIGVPMESDAFQGKLYEVIDVHLGLEGFEYGYYLGNQFLYYNERAGLVHRVIELQIRWSCIDDNRYEIIGLEFIPVNDISACKNITIELFLKRQCIIKKQQEMDVVLENWKEDYKRLAKEQAENELLINKTITL